MSVVASTIIQLDSGTDVGCWKVKSAIREDALREGRLSLCLQPSVRLSWDNVITGPSLLSNCH